MYESIQSSIVEPACEESRSLNRKWEILRNRFPSIADHQADVDDTKVFLSLSPLDITDECVALNPKTF